MDTQRKILSKCFSSPSSVWKSFMEKDEDLITLYYPSGGEDFRPFLFSKKECLEYTGAKIGEDYVEPNFFIYSDYRPNPAGAFPNLTTLRDDGDTSIILEEYHELIVKPDTIKYYLNENYVHFKPSFLTGKIFFFKITIQSIRLKKTFMKQGIYFFYENVNLLDQFFLKNKFRINQLVWKRDGSGYGGGRIRHDFLLRITKILEIKFLFVWDLYLDGKEKRIKYDDCSSEKCPPEIRKYLPENHQLILNRIGTFNWLPDRVNYYAVESFHPNISMNWAIVG